MFTKLVTDDIVCVHPRQRGGFGVRAQGPSGDGLVEVKVNMRRTLDALRSIQDGTLCNRLLSG
jgi:hypothetical protein